MEVTPEKFCICLLLGLKSSTGLWSTFPLNEDTSSLCDVWINGKSSKFHPVHALPPPCPHAGSMLPSWLLEKSFVLAPAWGQPPASCSAGHRCLSFLLLTVCNQSQCLPVLRACTSVSPGWAQPQSLCLTPLVLTNFLFCFGSNCTFKMWCCCYHLVSGVSPKITYMKCFLTYTFPPPLLSPLTASLAGLKGSITFCYKSNHVFSS